jgi:hypothetical protein
VSVTVSGQSQQFVCTQLNTESLWNFFDTTINFFIVDCDFVLFPKSIVLAVIDPPADAKTCILFILFSQNKNDG